MSMEKEKVCPKGENCELCKGENVVITSEEYDLNGGLTGWTDEVCPNIKEDIQNSKADDNRQER